MFKSIHQLFYEPIKEIDNFCLLKENITFLDCITIYDQSTSTEEKINILKVIKANFSHKNSQINICSFCCTNNIFSLNSLTTKSETDLETDIQSDKSNYSFYSNKNNDYICWIINEYFSENNDLIRQYLNDILILIISVVGVNKYDMNKIYEKLTKIYFYTEQKVDVDIFIKNIKLLSTLYGFKEDNTNENSNYIKNQLNHKPYNYYYFKGKEFIQINPVITSIDKSKINEGFSIFICFNCLLNPKYNNNFNNEKCENQCILFSIHFNNNNKCILSIDDKMNLLLKLHDNKNNKKKNIILNKIENNNWYNVSISLNLIKKNKKYPITISINNKFITNVEEIESDNIKINEISNIILCTDFIGFITNFIFFNKKIDSEELNYYQTKFKYGLYKFKHVNKFIDKINQNVLKNLVILLMPMETHNNEEINNLANGFIENNLTNNFEIKFISSIGKNYFINVNINHRLDKKINLIGGIENILPLFEILIKISKENNIVDFNTYQECLQIILNIINVILINHKTNTEGLINTKFFEIFSLFIKNISLTSKDKTKKELFSTKIMYSFIDLGSYLLNNINKFPKQCKSYLNNLLLNIKIIIKFSLINQNMIFDFIAKHLNSINTDNLIEYDNLFSILGYYNEYYKNYYCCEEHQNFYAEKTKKIDLKTPFDLITKIIGYSIKYNEDIYIKILHLLVVNSKPCLIKFILKNIFIANITKNENSKFIKYLVKNNLLNILLSLLSIYVYPDIISEIINMLSILSVQSNAIDNNNFFNRENVINYIGNSIMPIYVRIKKKGESNEKEKENNTSSQRPKTLAVSEIVFPKTDNNHNNENSLLKNANNSSDEDDLQDEYNGINIYNNNNLKKIRTEKIEVNYRKKSDDYYIQNKKFNLKKNPELNLNDDNENNNDNKNEEIQRKKSMDCNSDSESERKKGLPVIRSPRKLKSSIQNVINFGSITDKKQKHLLNKPSFESIYEKTKSEYMKLSPILDKLNQQKLSSFIQTILDSLLNWLKTDINNYVIKIIFIFFKYDKIEYVHIYKFIETLSIIINERIISKNNNLSSKLFNLDFYLWYFDIMFQFYLIKNNRKDIIESNNNRVIFSCEENNNINTVIDNILKKGSSILVNFINKMKMDKKELIALFDDLLLCGTKIKKYYSLNKNTIIYLNSFYLELFSNLLKEYQKYHTLKNSEQLIVLINICYEYMIFFNNENKSEDINNFIINDNQIFNGIILSGINTTNSNTPNISISKFWTDHSLFETLISVLKQIINIGIIDYKDDKFLEENILSHKKSDTYLEQISLLCNCQIGANNNINNNNNNDNNANNFEEIKNGELPIIYIISNLYVITINLINNKEEKTKILNEYKSFIIFLIISSSNLSYNPPMSTIIQDKVELILNYFIGFILERYNNQLDKDILIPCLIEVFILMIKVVKRTYDQIQNRKSNKFLNKIMSIASNQKKIDFSKCAVFRIFSKDSMSNVFNKNFVNTMKKNNFKDFNDKTYLVQLLMTCVNLKNIKNETKNIFFADKFIKKGHERVTTINEMKYKETYIDEDNENCFDLQFFKTRRKISTVIENALFALEEEIKIFKEKNYLDKLIIQNSYKKIKKNIFSFTGLWSYKDIFYNSFNDFEEDEIYENQNDSENSLEIINNSDIYKNKFILKYKLINHYGKIPFRPILTPIYDINNYLPSFSLFNKDNLFIEKEEGKNITTAINLNMEEIFNNENNTFSFINNTVENEPNELVISNIYQNVFPNAYEYYKQQLYPDYSTDKLLSSPLSGLISNSQSCCYIIQMSHIQGYLLLNKLDCSFIQNIYTDNNEIKIQKEEEEDEDYDEEKKMCYGSYIKLNKNKYVYLEIKYKSIQYIFLRKYYYKDSAIEIFTSKNKVYFFNFPDSYKRQCALNILLSKFTTKKEIKILKSKLIGYDVSTSNTYFNISNNNNLDFLSNIIEKWQDWNISTFELLLWLNILSNRSFNDISQYPVFPWILIQYKDDLESENKISLSKSYMPTMLKNNLKTKNVSSSFVKSNSGDINNKNTNFLKDVKEKKNDNESSDNKNEKESGSNGNTNNNQKNNYDQFPIDDKESQIILEKDIRNFSLPMGMMSVNDSGEKRKNNYILKYTMMKKEFEVNEKENKNSNNGMNINKQLYIYGSHYSNPLYVCHYLTRIFPFSNISIELQGDKFDDPNRLLISVNKSFEASASHEGDVRELCPEFFYLPEIFVNQNNLDLKIKSKKIGYKNSNDVTLPKWADNNRYIFITKLKTYLESEEVNKKINKWFDLIFGYKQKGKEAESSYNLFIPSSYDTFDIKNEAKSPDQKQYFLRLTEFGLTPHQIINKKFVKRRQKDNKRKTISESWREKDPIINQFENKKKDNKSNDLKILKLKFIDDENIIAILNNYQYIKYEILQFQYITEPNIRFDSNAKNYIKKEKISKLKYFEMRNNKIINKSCPIIIYDKGAYIAQGGFLDGKIIITQLNTKSKSKNINNVESSIINTFEIVNPMDRSPIIVLIISKNEKIIFSGSILGSVTIYNNEKNIWKKKSQINDHLNMPITSLFYNDNLNIWGSASYDGYINIYTFPSNKKITSIKVDSNGIYADYLFIISSPLPSLVYHCKNNCCFYSYSLIGKLICKEYEKNSEIFSPLIITESNFGEILMYGNDKGKIYMRYLPSLNLFLNKEIDMNYISIDCLEVSQNGRYCTAWNNENGIFYVLYDPSLISENEELMILHLANDLDE